MTGLQKEALAGIISKAFGYTSEQNEQARKEGLRRRSQNRQAFLGIAEDLLRDFGVDTKNEENQDTRLTEPPVEVKLIWGPTVPVHVLRQVLEHDTGYCIDRVIVTAIVAREETDSLRSLFSIVQDRFIYPSGAQSSRTLIRNQRGVIASNQEVTSGLEAIQFIATQLQNKPQ